MSHPTCCCSVSLDRCDRCDLLVGLEGFHVMSAARTPSALVLDIESCDHCAGCPGCGVIAQGHRRVVVEVIDAPWAGVPARIRWHKRRWICRETTCQTVTFLEHDARVCAPRARVGVIIPRPGCWTWCRVGLAPCIRTGWPSAAKTSVRECESRHWIPSRDSKNAIAWPAPRRHQHAGCLPYRQARR